MVMGASALPMNIVAGPVIGRLAFGTGLTGQAQAQGPRFKSCGAPDIPHLGRRPIHRNSQGMLRARFSRGATGAGGRGPPAAPSARPSGQDASRNSGSSILAASAARRASASGSNGAGGALARCERQRRLDELDARHGLVAEIGVDALDELGRHVLELERPGADDAEAQRPPAWRRHPVPRGRARGARAPSVARPRRRRSPPIGDDARLGQPALFQQRRRHARGRGSDRRHRGAGPHLFVSRLPGPTSLARAVAGGSSAHAERSWQR